MTLVNRYLFRETFSSILLIMLALLAIFSFFDLIQELENLGKGSYTLSRIFVFVLLSAPGHVYEVVPVAVLIGALYALAQTSRNSELVVMQASGMSILRIGKPLLWAGILFGILTFVVGELVTPVSEKTAQRLRIKATHSIVAQEFRSGFWVKDANTFVNVRQVKPDAELLDINIYRFNQNFELTGIDHAKSGRYNGKHWLLKEIRQTTLSQNKVVTKFYPENIWVSLIKPELLNVLLVVPEKMSATSLYSYIKHLTENKQKTSRYEIALWSKLIYPIASAVMIVLALPFGFVQQRAGGVGAKIFTGIILGILFQVLNRVFVHLGLLNDWSAMFSTIVPTILFLLTGLLMLHGISRR
ncbi:MAG: LPS export ABC transporter permease LptG [Methylophilaceae bacterium]